MMVYLRSRFTPFAQALSVAQALSARRVLPASGRRTALLGPICLLLLGCLLPALHAAQPNIIFIMADDLGYGDLGVYGHPEIYSPEIDRMASDGVRLTEAYSPAPTCSPSRVPPACIPSSTARCGA